jgi:hypothetical protein
MNYENQRRTNRHYRPSQSFPDVLSGIIVLAAVGILLGAMIATYKTFGHGGATDARSSFSR